MVSNAGRPSSVAAAEELVQQVVRVTEGALTAATGDRPLEGAAAAEAGPHLISVLPVVSEAVVLAALFGVRQDLVRLVDLLEAALGVLVSWVQVGVVLPRHAPKRLAHCHLVGVLGHSEGIVVAHRNQTVA